ncbi:glycosyltransferase family 4 protein [Patulibacter defluvii]|uniref:glycosyltransferase family 4 protein n=1 Tax=Patulibacter defluvii TaxID=3095358 RepID=UPI002A75DFBF|nr:glycosyltransferase family 4 protein [Patulibacter sp. DM4]
MRVLLVSQEYPPETGWGGIGTYLGLVAPALAAAGAEVHVLSVVDGQPSSTRSADGVTVHRRGLGRRVRGPGRVLPQSWKRIELAAAVARAVRALDGSFDVVESPEWMAESLLLRRRPLVVRLHSSAAQVFPFVGRSGLDARLAIAAEERGIARADLLVGTAVQLASHRHAVPDVAISYPVALREPRPAWDPAGGAPPRIVFAGRFEHRKGVDRLLEALPAVRRRVPTALLEIVGRDTTTPTGGSVLDELRARAAALGVADGLRVTEKWGREAVEEALDGAAVCAVPSRWESFGYVAAEALSGATPLVVSDWPSFRDVTGDEGLVPIVAGDDPEAWGAALAAAIEDPRAAREAAEAGRDRLRERAAPAVVAGQTLDAYARARAGRGR